MNKRESSEYRRALNERDSAEREYAHLIERRQEIEGRQVKNEQIKQRFLTRLSRDIDDARQKLTAADLALEGFEK